MQAWILGGGQFGAVAVNRLAALHPNWELVVVDDSPSRAPDRAMAAFVCADALDYLAEHLGTGRDPDWILPCVPFHLAADWIRSRVPEKAPAPVPAHVRNLLPNPMDGPGGRIYVSHADFLCPNDCPEPADVCTKTGQRRGPDLWRVIAGLDVPGHEPVVIPSRQLAPGVGGYRPRALFEAAARVQQTDRCALVATACRCHGVIDNLCPAPPGAGF